MPCARDHLRIGALGTEWVGPGEAISASATLRPVRTKARQREVALRLGPSGFRPQALHPQWVVLGRCRREHPFC
jgi:hypothetical protein